MKTLKQEQLLPITITQAWDFFSRPENLNAITPKNMSFKILSNVPEKMYEGLIIYYQIRPMFNIAVFWCTEITHIRDKEYFIDEQREGPYRFWHHEHHFKEVDDGVIMTDILHYDIGKSFLGWIAGQLFVHRRVKQIFNYRYHILENYFG